MRRPPSKPWRSAFVLLALATPAGACGGTDTSPKSPAGNLDLPGVDTHDFTSRERHELSEYVTELPSPCSTVAVPVGQCVVERRPCAACGPATLAIAKAVRDGMTREQVRSLYKARFD
ncbi:MAG TPA: hypothetical protein VN894_16770, partial [Polyangiaceae bacterium]|nr:hypothetical protein [Polyangiaceae bacterium]